MSIIESGKGISGPRYTALKAPTHSTIDRPAGGMGELALMSIRIADKKKEI
jgi:hypothetical protein